MRARSVNKCGWWAVPCLVLWLLVGSGLGAPDARASELDPIAEALDEARALHRGGELEHAIAAYTSVAERARESQPDAAAAALNNACLAQRTRGHVEQAVNSCMEALELRRLGDDERGISRTLNNLGLSLTDLGRYDEAETRFLEALRINVKRGDLEGHAVNLGNLAQLSISQGHLGRALIRLDSARDLVSQEDGGAWARRQLAYTQFNQGVLLEKMGLFDEALTTYLTIESGALSLTDRSTVALNRGVLYRNLGDPQLALEALGEARELASRDEYERGEIFAILNTGIVLERNLSDPATAREHYSNALQKSLDLGDPEVTTRVRLYLLELDAGNASGPPLETIYDRFLEVGQEAKASLYVEDAWRADSGAARASVRLGDRQRARSHFRAAIEGLEEIRGEIQGSGFGDRFHAEARPVYVEAVENLLALGEIRSAYEFVLRSKRRYDGWTAVGEVVSDVQAGLGRAVLVEYFIGRTALYRWTLREDDIAFEETSDFRAIARNVEQLHRNLSDGQTPAEDLIGELSDTLLPASLKEDAPRRLYVAADGRLGYLPVELLLRHRPGEPAAPDVVVSYLPSGANLTRTPRQARTPDLRFAGLANPSLDRQRDVIATRGRIDRLELGALPGAERELQRVLSKMGKGTVSYVGEHATEKALSDIANRGTAVLHLGAHTVIEEGLGAESAILLTPGEHDDGLLLPSEIAGLNLPTGLTVLAGCRTAIGFDDRSTALSDLAGAFLESGSGAVLATLWEVGDQPTEVFMNLFYTSLLRGTPPAEALLEAKEELRSDPRWAAPHLWSPYVLIGTGDEPVLTGRDHRWAFAAVGLALVALTLAIWLILEARTRTVSAGPLPKT